MDAINDLQLDVLKQFVTVADEKSFSKAARLLNMQPSTLSRHIAAFEKELDVRLLQRTTRTVVLTPDGATLHAKIAPLLKQLDLATRSVVEAKGNLDGLVRIATSSTMAEICIVPLLPELRRRYPGIRLEFVLNTEIVDLRTQPIDFAVRAGTLREETQVVRKIGAHAFHLYSAPACLDEKAPRILSFATGFPTLTPPVLMCEDYYLIRNLVTAGEGQAWMPGAFCFEQERRGELVRVAPADSISFDVFVAYHKGSMLTGRARIVMDLIIQHAKTTSALEKEMAKRAS